MFPVSTCSADPWPVLLCGTGSCPNLMMSRSEHADARPVAVALTPQLPPRAHRPLCMSVSSDSSGRFKALETQEWKNNLKAQVVQPFSSWSLLVAVVKWLVAGRENLNIWTVKYTSFRNWPGPYDASLLRYPSRNMKCDVLTCQMSRAPHLSMCWPTSPGNAEEKRMEKSVALIFFDDRKLSLCLQNWIKSLFDGILGVF